MALVQKIAPNQLILLEDGTSIMNRACITVKLVRLTKEETIEAIKKTQSKNGKKDEKLCTDPT